MKTVQVNSFFRKVKESTSPNFGKRRPELSWSFQGIEASDIDTLPKAELVCVINDSLEKFGKNLLLKNADNWDYVPENVTIAALVEDILAETTRTRTVTKESLAKAGAFYEKYAHLIGKLPANAKAGGVVIANKLAQVSGNADSLKVMLDSISSFMAKVVESVEDTEVLAEFEELLPVYEWLEKECKSLIDATDILSSL